VFKRYANLEGVYFFIRVSVADRSAQYRNTRSSQIITAAMTTNRNSP